MATRYYNLENEAKAYLKACSDRGIVNQTSTKILNDYIIARKNNNLDASFLATNPIALNGLVLWLDASVGSSYSAGGNIWKDLSNSNINGTLVNGPTYSRASGGSIVFDNVDDLVNCGQSATLNLINNFTLDVWFNASGYGEGNLGRLLDKASGVTGFAFLLDNLNVVNGVQFNSNGVGTHLVANCVTLNQNTNLTIVINNSTSFLYKNGILISTSNPFTTITTSPTVDLIIGNRSSLDRTFNGSIYNTKIYNRVLSATEILQNYNAQRSRFGL
jgi:hypothetical protein